VADVALQQRFSPDPEAPRSIQHSPTPGTLVDQPVGGTRIRESVQGWQWDLDKARRGHRKCRRHNAG